MSCITSKFLFFAIGFSLSLSNARGSLLSSDSDTETEERNFSLLDVAQELENIASSDETLLKDNKTEFLEKDCNRILLDSSKKRRKKQELALEPKISSEKIYFKSSNKKKTGEYEVYILDKKEQRRAFRNLLQKYYDEYRTDKKNTFDLFVQKGKIKAKISSGLDVAVYPLKEYKKGKYKAKNAPPYKKKGDNGKGGEVSEEPKEFKEILKLVEGCRSVTAPVLSHIAEEHEEFIGLPKGGAKRLRNADGGMEKLSKKEKLLVKKSLGRFFEKKKKKDKNGSKNKDKLIDEMIEDLGTETSDEQSSESKILGDDSAKSDAEDFSDEKVGNKKGDRA